jgi:TonB family protein
VRRSFLIAFIIALILHALLAWVELDIFKRPIPRMNTPKALTMDLVKPEPLKTPAVKKSPIVVKKSKDTIVREEVQEKIKQKPEVKPKVKDKKKFHQEKPRTREKPTEKVESLARLIPVDRPATQKEEVTPERYNSFLPEKVDIPMALPKEKDIPQSEKKVRLPDSTASEPINIATPNYKENSPPLYPRLARRKNYQGTVFLDVLVRMDGTVGSIRLSKSSGYELLDSAAIRGVKKWLFHPGKRGDELVEMWVKIPIRFQLK